MKYLLVGLGNPGPTYKNTRHNIGFMILDALAEKNNTQFEQDRHANIAYTKFKGRQLILVKPTTFMNLSGKAVQYHLQKHKTPLNQLLVVLDDIAIPFGQFRLKPKGSAGGHNGLKDIQATINSQLYPRLRVGIGDNFSKGKQSDYVLGNFSEEEMFHIPDILTKSIEAIQSFVSIGIERSMGEINRKNILE